MTVHAQPAASLPTPTADQWARLASLRDTITNDIAAAELEASQIAERRRVTKRAVLAMLFQPGDTCLCVHCQASGSVNGGVCRACLGSGYNSEVKIG